MKKFYKKMIKNFRINEKRIKMKNEMNFYCLYFYMIQRDIYKYFIFHLIKICIKII